jgi:anti-sigma B factor antagonist
MVIDERPVGPATVLTPHGRLTIETFGELKSQVSRLLEDGRIRIVLNLGSVAYVDSMGVAELVRVHVMLDRGGGRLALSHLQRPVEELLRLTGLREIFFIFPTEAEAVQGCTRRTSISPADRAGPGT